MTREQPAISNCISSPPELTFLASENDAGHRLDHFLASLLPHLSRSRIQQIIRAGGATRNGAPTRSSETVRNGDRIIFCEPDPVTHAASQAEDIPLTILYEDRDLIVLDKPAGLVVHPGAGNAHGTLVNALLHHCGSLSVIGGVERPGIVHRLDKETSGCLVVAKNDQTHRSLQLQFAAHEIKKTYLAVVASVPRIRSGVINEFISRHPVNRQKMAVSEAGRGRDAVTSYQVIAVNEGIALVECTPKTGRTHQIRVHLKHLGFPVLGDPLYGRREKWKRHFLHAWKLGFTHPASGKMMEFISPPPQEFLTLFPKFQKLAPVRKRKTGPKKGTLPSGL